MCIVLYNGNQTYWYSQPKVNGMHTGNVLLYYKYFYHVK